MADKNLVKFVACSKEIYEAKDSYDPYTLYFVSQGDGTGRLYKGNVPFGDGIGNETALPSEGAIYWEELS